MWFTVVVMAEKFIGSLLGLAVCDAIGTTVECMPRGSFTEVRDMIGGGKFNLLPGQVIDPIYIYMYIYILYICIVC